MAATAGCWQCLRAPGLSLLALLARRIVALLTKTLLVWLHRLPTSRNSKQALHSTLL
jgi:hypothetical protein